MKRKLIIVSVLCIVCMLLIPTISNALPVASDGSGSETSMSGFVSWWTSPDRWWN